MFRFLLFLHISPMYFCDETNENVMVTIGGVACRKFFVNLQRHPTK